MWTKTNSSIFWHAILYPIVHHIQCSIHLPFYIAEFALLHCGFICGWLTVPRNSLEKSTTPLPSIICILALESDTTFSVLSWEAAEQETLLGRSHTNGDPTVLWLTMPRAGSPVHHRGGKSREVTAGQTWHLLKILTAGGSKWVHIQHSAATCDKSDDLWQNSAVNTC